MNVIGAEELVFYKDDKNNIYSGGFNVNSVLFKLGVPPINTLHKSGGGGGVIQENVSDLFKDLAVPNWLLSTPTPTHSFIGGRVNPVSDTAEIIDNDLHDELLRLVSVEHTLQLPKTKKQKHKIQRITRKKRNNKI